MSMQAEMFDRPVINRGVERIRARNEARARADLGMNRVADKADRLNGGDWCRQATKALRKFAAGQHGMFLIEVARVVIARDLPPVHDARAWGRVTVMALAAGYIVKTKLTAPAASSNGAPKALYVKGQNA